MVSMSALAWSLDYSGRLAVHSITSARHRTTAFGRHSSPGLPVPKPAGATGYGAGALLFHYIEALHDFMSVVTNLPFSPPLPLLLSLSFSPSPFQIYGTLEFSRASPCALTAVSDLQSKLQASSSWCAARAGRPILAEEEPIASPSCRATVLLRDSFQRRGPGRSARRRNLYERSYF